MICLFIEYTLHTNHQILFFEFNLPLEEKERIVLNLQGLII